MQEIFKVIEGYEGLYEVSNLGNVRSLGMWTNACNGSKQFRKGRMLKPGKDKDGYLMVVLHKDGKHKACKVHRLVAQAFLPNPENLPCVNHKDEDKTNNFVCVGVENLESNLEWCDSKYNANFGTRNTRMSEKHSKKVQAFNKDGELVYEFPSAREAERNGFNHGSISTCCRGERKTAYGYVWKYA